MIREYSLTEEGDLFLAKNFQVREFRCKDGADEIVIDDELVFLLQLIRSHFRSPVNIHSAYRTEAHNKAIGGSSASYHLTGQAADFDVSGVPAAVVGAYVDSILPDRLGIEIAVDGSYIHVDVRTSRWRAWEKSGSYKTVERLFPMK